MVAGSGWCRRAFGQRLGMPRHPDQALQEHPVRQAAVERVRVVPPLGEHGEDVGDDRAPEFHRGVVPRRVLAVPGVDRDRLRVAPVCGVVAAAVREVDAADVGDVPRGVVAVLDHEELLVVGAEHADALVEEHLAAGVVDLPPEQLVRPGAQRRRDALAVGAPDQPADLDARPCPLGQEVTDRRTVRQQPLVSVTAPVGEPHAVPGLQRGELGVDPLEVGRPVHQRPHEVALGPRGGVAAAGVYLGGGVAALVAGQEPVTRVGGHDRTLRGGHAERLMNRSSAAMPVPATLPVTTSRNQCCPRWSRE
jgi:hypothetical protein